MRLVALGMFLVVAAVIAAYTITQTFAGDVNSYWTAAERLRAGEPLYRSDVNIGSTAIYLYSPWFAFAWIPLTFLPRDLVEVAWVALMAGCAVAAVVPLARTRTLEGAVMATLLGVFLLYAAFIGNAAPLMIAGLVWFRSPVMIGLAASLKITPLVLAVVYAGRGEWSKVAVAVGVTTVLWLPALALGVLDYPLGTGLSTLSMLAYAPILWGVVALVAVAVAFWLAPTRYAWLGAAAALMACLPRMLFYDIGYLAISRSPEPRISSLHSAAAPLRRTALRPHPE